MKYCKWNDEYSPIAPGTEYLEINENWANRQIAFNGEEYLASNVIHPRWGMGLAEGKIDYEELVEAGEATPVTKEEFEAIWQAHLALHQGEWKAAKQSFPVGEKVAGWIHIFYPHGVIVNFGKVLGVADYNVCRASTERENMYPRHRVTAIVSGYDEENQWIILDSPQVHPDQVP